MHHLFPKTRHLRLYDDAAGTRQQLLAVNLNPCCGIALYGNDGKLCWYRSQLVENPNQLRRVARAITSTAMPLGWLVTEGEIDSAAIWERIAMKNGVRVQRVSAAAWRDRLLPSYRGHQPTRDTIALAQRVIAWSKAEAPTHLSNDAAEAILIGLWGVLQLRWLERVPAFLRQDYSAAASY